MENLEQVEKEFHSTETKRTTGKHIFETCSEFHNSKKYAVPRLNESFQSSKHSYNSLVSTSSNYVYQYKRPAKYHHRSLSENSYINPRGNSNEFCIRSSYSGEPCVSGSHIKSVRTENLKQLEKEFHSTEMNRTTRKPDLKTYSEYDNFWKCDASRLNDRQFSNMSYSPVSTGSSYSNKAYITGSKYFYRRKRPYTNHYGGFRRCNKYVGGTSRIYDGSGYYNVVGTSSTPERPWYGRGRKRESLKLPRDYDNFNDRKMHSVIESLYCSYVRKETYFKINRPRVSKEELDDEIDRYMCEVKGTIPPTKNNIDSSLEEYMVETEKSLSQYDPLTAFI